MMPETVIKLQRGLTGFRETRSPGAYCPACRTGLPLQNHHVQVSMFARLRKTVRDLLPPWRHPEVSLDAGGLRGFAYARRG